MEQVLTVTHRDGTTFDLQSKGSEVWGITGATQSVELNAGDTVTVNVLSTTPLPFALGDKITVYGKTYTINELPRLTKTGRRRYQYTCIFEGEQYYLLNTLWQMPFSVINETYTGDLEDFGTLIVTNLVRVYGNGSWSLGNVPADTETKTLSYADTNCLDVLQQICSEWEVEFEIEKTVNSHTLHFKTKVGGSIDHEFMYGKAGGGYELQRNGVNDPDFGTRIYFYGGSNNISNAYYNNRQSPRLCLARKVVGNTTTNNPNKANSYIQQPDAVNKYGLIERVKVFEDIYPNRIGTVTGIDAESEVKFSDSSMFNLNETDSQGNTKWLIPGTTAQIHFNTGALAGYDFDIVSYKHSTHTFTIHPKSDDNNYTFPSPDNNTFRIAVGDEYIITDIVLPDAYVTGQNGAQEKLQAAAQEWYQQHCAPAVEYTMNLDQMFVKRLAEEMEVSDGAVFHIGDEITVTDEAMGFTQKVFRIVKFTRDITRPYAYTIDIAETNLNRAQYNWRRRTRYIPDIVHRLGLDDVAFPANAAAQAVMTHEAFNTGNNNSTRIGYIIDDNNKLRPAIIPDNAIIARMINSGAVTRAKLAADAMRHVENITSRVFYQYNEGEDRAEVVITAGTYTNTQIENEPIPISNNVLIADIEGNPLDAALDYYIYFDTDSKMPVVSTMPQDVSKYIEIGLMGACEDPSDNKTARPVVMNPVTLTPQDFIFVRSDGTSGKVKDIDTVVGINANSGLRKDTSDLKTTVGNNNSGLVKKTNDIESVVGADANSGLRKKTADLETTVGGANSGLVKDVADISNDLNNQNTGLAAIRSAINTLKSKVNGITYEDCAHQVCATITIPDLPWEAVSQ